MQLSELFNKIDVVEDFPRKGVSFKDIMPILSDPFARKALSTYLMDTIPSDVDAIVAPESRGLMLAFLLSDLPIEIIPLRKKGKLPGDVISYTYNTEYSTDTLECQKKDLLGKRCWFIDDISCTLGTYKAAEYLVHNLGATIVGGTVLFDIGGNLPNTIVELFKEVK